jgi:hypothetical protein
MLKRAELQFDILIARPAQTAANVDGYASNAFVDIGGDGQIKIVAIARAKIETPLPLTVIVSRAFGSRLINAKASGAYFAPYSQRR